MRHAAAIKFIDKLGGTLYVATHFNGSVEEMKINIGTIIPIIIDIIGIRPGGVGG
jgi:hypothetical protein